MSHSLVKERSQVGRDRGGVVAQLAVGDADHAPALDRETAIARAIVLERQARTVVPQPSVSTTSRAADQRKSSSRPFL
jgi:hypothetical protein